MTSLTIAQLASVLLAISTPWIVAAIARRVATTPAGDRRMFMPITFAAAALIFLWLYEVWAHQVITGPIVAGDAGDLRRGVAIAGCALALASGLVGRRYESTHA